MGPGGGGVGCPVGGGSAPTSSVGNVQAVADRPTLSGDRTAHSKRDCSLLPRDSLRESRERRFTNQGGRMTKTIDGELIVKNLYRNLPW